MSPSQLPPDDAMWYYTYEQWGLWGEKNSSIESFRNAVRDAIAKARLRVTTFITRSAPTAGSDCAATSRALQILFMQELNICRKVLVRYIGGEVT